MTMRPSCVLVGLAALVGLIPASFGSAGCPKQDATFSVAATADGGLKAPRYFLRISCSGGALLTSQLSGRNPSRSDRPFRYSAEQLRELRHTIDAAAFFDLPADVSGHPSPPDAPYLDLKIVSEG